MQVCKHSKNNFAIKKIAYIVSLLMILPSVVCAQHFESSRLINSREVPCEAFLYNFPSSTVRQAALNVFAKYNVTSSVSGTRETFVFLGDSLGATLMSQVRVKFWIEELGDDRSVLYLTALKNTGEFATILKHSVVNRRIRDYLTAIEMESITISSRLFLSEQYLRVYRLTDEIQMLYDDLQRLELYTPNATTQINQIRSTIRTKSAILTQETDILNRFRENLE